MKGEQRVFPANPLVFAELDERRARYERRAAECYAQLVEAARKLEAEALADVNTGRR